MTQTQHPPVVAGLRLVRLVGRGGEGDVWEAVAINGERRAVKLVRPEAVAAPDQVAIRGDWLRRIDHPALVRVRRTAMLGDEPWRGWGLVEMDFVDGADLSPPSARPEALPRLASLAEGLDWLHDGRWSGGTPLVHRDIKPANLIATTDDRIVLVDNSSLCGVDRTMLTRIGTPVFAAPEVLTGRIGPPADIYSFAATVVALSSGARGEALLALVERPWLLDVPDTLRRALDADPARRPGRCASLLEREVLRTGDGWLPAEVGARRGQPSPALQAPPAAERLPVVLGSIADGVGTPARPGPEGDSAVPDELVPAPPPLSVWPYLALLGGVVALLGGAALQPDTVGVPWLVTAVALSVVAHAGANRSVWGAVVAAPVSWSFLLAERATTVVSRRDWVRSTLTGLLGGGTLLGWQAIEQTGAAASSRLLVATVAIAYLLTVATVATARRGTGTFPARVALTPATVIGSVALLAGAVVLLPIGLFTGDRRRARRLGAQALRAIGAIAVFGHEPDAGLPVVREDGPARTIVDPERTERRPSRVTPPRRLQPVDATPPRLDHGGSAA